MYTTTEQNKAEHLCEWGLDKRQNIYMAGGLGPNPCGHKTVKMEDELNLSFSSRPASSQLFTLMMLFSPRVRCFHEYK
jgi:hypothetical protein